MKRPDSPCLGCDDRSAECHASCTEYIQCVEENKKYKKLIADAKEEEMLGTTLTDKRFKQYQKNKQYKIRSHHS